MRIAFLSDVHGNDVALAACLDRLDREGIHQAHFLGDAVGYFPAAAEVLSRLRSRVATCLRGNHEDMLLGRASLDPRKDAVYALHATRLELGAADIGWLDSWPEFHELRIADKRFLLVHGSPTDPVGGYVYPDSDLACFSSVSYDAVLMGHTHYPFVRTHGRMTFVNAGSVGLPRDQGDLSSAAIYDSERNEFDILRVPFDVTRTLETYGSRIHDSVRQCLFRRARRTQG